MGIHAFTFHPRILGTLKYPGRESFTRSWRRGPLFIISFFMAINDRAIGLGWQDNYLYLHAIHDQRAPGLFASLTTGINDATLMACSWRFRVNCGHGK